MRKYIFKTGRRGDRKFGALAQEFRNRVKSYQENTSLCNHGEKAKQPSSCEQKENSCDVEVYYISRERERLSDMCAAVKKARCIPAYMTQCRIYSLSLCGEKVVVTMSIRGIKGTVEAEKNDAIFAYFIAKARTTKNLAKGEREKHIRECLAGKHIEGTYCFLAENGKDGGDGNLYLELECYSSSHAEAAKRAVHAISEVAKDANRTEECVRATRAFGIPDVEIEQWVDKVSLIKELSARLNKPRSVINGVIEGVAFKEKNGLAKICTIQDVENAIKRSFSAEEVRWSKALHDAFNCGEHSLP